MFTSVVYLTFAYCSVLRVLLASLGRHWSVARVRVVLRSLRAGCLPPASTRACVTIAGIATPRYRNDPAAIDNGDVLQDFERHGALQRGQADRHRDRRRRRRKRGFIGRQPIPRSWPNGVAANPF